MLRRRVLRRHLVGISVETGVLRRVLRRGGVIEGAEKAETRPLVCVRPPSRAPYLRTAGVGRSLISFVSHLLITFLITFGDPFGFLMVCSKSLTESQYGFLYGSKR